MPVLFSTVPGIALLAVGLLADHITGIHDGFGAGQLVMVLAGGAGIVLGVVFAQRMPRATRKIHYSLLVGMMTLAVAEVVCSLAVFFADLPSDTFWIFEESGRTFHFDPVRGYRLTTTPSRVARITNGEVEYVGVYRGNEQGFPDQDDFTVDKPAHVDKRYLVFGDSFTAAQFLHRNWPEYIEQQQDDRWQLYNFSTDGAGLANWWSNFVHIAEEEAYQYDGVIFAVFAGDLRRSFSVAEHRGFDRHMFGRVPTWTPAEFPQTDAEAKKYLRARRGYILSGQAFGRAIQDRRLRVRKRGLEHLWITHSGYRALRSALAPDESAPPGELSAGQRALISDIQARLQSRGIQPIVVHIPMREEILSGSVNLWKAETQEFARILDARFVDGSDAFAGLSPLMLRDEWFPFDGHWAQGGSDRFARFFLRVLAEEDDAASATPKAGAP